MKANWKIKLNSSSAAETKTFGKLLAKVLGSGDLVILVGALGGGKTTFTKGILKGLGYRRRVLSPSFTLVRQYPVKNLLIHHVDLYRLDERGTFSLGIEDFIYKKGNIAIVEWGDKIKQILDQYIAVKFSYCGENKRKLSVSVVGYPKQRLKSIKDELISS